MGGRRKLDRGASPQAGNNGAVCPDRALRPSNPQNFATGSLQSHDPGSAGVPSHRKTASSIRLSVLLTPRQAAEFLSVRESTLAQWRSQQRGPLYIKLEGRLVRYRASDVEDYLARHAVETEVDKVPAAR